MKKKSYFKQFLILTLSLLSCIFLQSCQSEDPASPAINYIQLASAFNHAGEVDGIKSLVVEKNGSVLAEEYFNGYDPEELHDVRSVTKSFTSALIGIAINKGFIQSVDQKLSEFLVNVVDSLDEDKGNITLHQLLSMSCGLEWEEIGGYSEFNEWVTSPDQINYILEKPFVTTPGTHFNYSDGAAHLVSVILEEATGMSSLEFAKEYLFTPLGIGDRDWLTDNRGYNYGGVGLKITPADMLKFGRLFLNDGKYNNIQVISEEWINLSTQSHITTNNAVPYGPEYGYFWWRTRENSHDIYFAMGYGGQFIIIIPDINAIVVATCRWQNTGGHADEHWYSIISIIMEEILPAID